MLLVAAAVDGAAETEPPVTLNAGFADAWYNPATSGQGFFLAVYPELPLLFLSWFTYDTERPPDDAEAIFGAPDHRWITAFGPIFGHRAVLEIELTRGGVLDQEAPDPVQSVEGAMTVEFQSCSAGQVSYDIPGLGLEGEVPIQRLSDSNVALCESLLAEACKRPDPDLSHGPNEPVIRDGSSIPANLIVDGGPGPDGIPPLEIPNLNFTQNYSSTLIRPSDLVIGVKNGDETRAYPHHILWWHEVVNDNFIVDDERDFFTLSYCPLTGTGMFWEATPERVNKTYGTSGLLYNSNLILYDRATQSLWSQMLEQAVSGPKILTIPERRQVVETTWATWLAMYPDTLLLSEDTGFSRDYNLYPYGSYRTNDSVLFDTNNLGDDRLLRKERVLGINVGDAARAYPIVGFPSGVNVVQETVGGMDVVVAGSNELNFAVVYNRQLADCTVLEFEAVQDRLPVIMRDNEGNEWDVFGYAVSGPRSGSRLEKTNSYVSYWFAWTAFFPHTTISR